MVGPKRLHQVRQECLNVKSMAAVSPTSGEWKLGPNATGSIILGLDGVLNRYRRRKSIEPKYGQDSHNRNFRIDCGTMLGAPGREQDAKTPYPNSMVDQYLMDRNDEIALARSAAPPSVAEDAAVMGLGRDGYETAVEGTNGFVCNIDRSWMNEFENSPEFWNPKRRGPVCYNLRAARTVLLITLIRTRLALAVGGFGCSFGRSLTSNANANSRHEHAEKLYRVYG